MSNSSMIFTEFMRDVEANIESRITGLPKHDVQDLSAYITNRAIILVNDCLHASLRVDKAEAVRRLGQHIARTREEGELE